MANSWFRFKQFTIQQEKTAMKVTTDGCLFGAWAAGEIQKSKVKIKNVLDAGSGTGLLSLMMAQRCNANIVAVEIDAAAAEEAARNFAASPWANRLKVICGDILPMKFPEPFDVIICNPPFYENDLEGPDEKRNTAHHSAGLKIDHLLPVLFDNLSAAGRLYLLLPFRRKQELLAMIGEKCLFVHASLDVVPAKHATRWMVALRKYKPEKIESATLHIKNGDAYTTEFRRLLHDYYLRL